MCCLKNITTTERFWARSRSKGTIIGEAPPAIPIRPPLWRTPRACQRTLIPYLSKVTICTTAKISRPAIHFFSSLSYHSCRTLFQEHLLRRSLLWRLTRTTIVMLLRILGTSCLANNSIANNDNCVLHKNYAASAYCTSAWHLLASRS